MKLIKSYFTKDPTKHILNWQDSTTIMESLAEAASQIWDLSVHCGFGPVCRQVYDRVLQIHGDDCWRASIELVVVAAHLSRNPEFGWTGKYLDTAKSLILTRIPLDEFIDKITGRALLTIANEHGSRGNITGLRWVLKLADGISLLRLEDYVG